MKWIRCLPVSALIMIAVCAGAQSEPYHADKTTKLVDMDTPLVLEGGKFEALGQVRVFGGDEKQAYGHVELNGGLGHNLGFVLRSSFSGNNTFHGNGFDIRHGGSDFEGMLKYQVPELPNLAFEGGLAYPNTPAQKHVFGTGQVVYEIQANPVNFYVGARGVAGPHSNLAGIGAGLSAAVTPEFELFGDATWVFTGENTYSTTDGSLQRRSVYGVGVRYTGAVTGGPNYSIEVGASNAIGGTTGFSLTPALGSNIGFYASVRVRF